MSREEPYDGTEAQFAEDEEDDTSQNRGEGKGDKRGSNDRLGVVFSNNFDDIVREDVEERLPGQPRVNFLGGWQEVEATEGDVQQFLSSSCRFHLRNRYHRM
jgi:hypothetical protein